jgi:hypothetical protein
MAEKILSWRHAGFNVYSKVRTTTSQDARTAARYMAMPILALGRLSFDLAQDKVIYRYGETDKVYEVDPLACPTCGAQMKVIAFITNYTVIDKIIHHLGITFSFERPPPAAQQDGLY